MPKILDSEKRRIKLDRLTDLEGYDRSDDLLCAVVNDSLCPAICCNPDNPECDYTAEMEPDQDRGWCKVCERGTLVSGLVLGGII